MQTGTQKVWVGPRGSVFLKISQARPKILVHRGTGTTPCSGGNPQQLAMPFLPVLFLEEAILSDRNLSYGCCPGPTACPSTGPERGSSSTKAKSATRPSSQASRHPRPHPPGAVAAARRSWDTAAWPLHRLQARPAQNRPWPPPPLPSSGFQGPPLHRLIKHPPAGAAFLHAAG